jgi:hypothetical protein
MAKGSSPKSLPPERLPVVERPPERSGNIPVFAARHRALKASVWQNSGENGVFFNVTVSRSFKEGDTWRESGSFGYDDVLIVAELLRTCHGFISREMAKASQEARG